MSGPTADSPQGLNPDQLVSLLKQADAAYKPFPPFSLWSKRSVDHERWQRYANRIEGGRGVARETLERALRVVRRMAAVDSGAIEGLYDVDRGFTYTVAVEAAHWQEAVERKGPRLGALIHAQLQTYEMVLDAATQRYPVTEALIRRFHEELCREQKTYLALTPQGWQEQQLPLGVYKRLSNHVVLSNGTVHAYCPPQDTPSEMHRLCEELATAEFESAHPVLQASYAHYGLVTVHPFADGNGRVARALASIYFYWHDSIPFLVLVDEKEAYFDALARSDQGDCQAFVDYVTERGISGFRLIAESIAAATAPTVEEAAGGLRRLYVTRGGYPHAEVDAAGRALLHVFQKEFSDQIAQLNATRLFSATEITNPSGALFPQTSPTYRSPASGPHAFHYVLRTQSPAEAGAEGSVQVEVPVDTALEDEIALRWKADMPPRDAVRLMDAGIAELLPRASKATELRATMAARRLVATVLGDLGPRAAAALKEAGY
jgi:Fic family protein